MVVRTVGGCVNKREGHWSESEKVKLTELGGWEGCEHAGEGSIRDDSRFLTCLVGWKVVLTKQGSIREDTIAEKIRDLLLRHKKCGRLIYVSGSQGVGLPECVLIVYLTSKESSGHFQTRPCHFTITRILAAPHLCQQSMLSVIFYFTDFILLNYS